MKPAKPVITNTEILCRAIRNILDEICQQENLWGGVPSFAPMLRAYIDERTPKLEALKQMYRIETGTDY